MVLAELNFILEKSHSHYKVLGYIWGEPLWKPSMKEQHTPMSIKTQREDRNNNRQYHTREINVKPDKQQTIINLKAKHLL